MATGRALTADTPGLGRGVRRREDRQARGAAAEGGTARQWQREAEQALGRMGHVVCPVRIGVISLCPTATG